MERLIIHVAERFAKICRFRSYAAGIKKFCHFPGEIDSSELHAFVSPDFADPGPVCEYAPVHPRPLKHLKPFRILHEIPVIEVEAESFYFLVVGDPVEGTPELSGAVHVRIPRIEEICEACYRVDGSDQPRRYVEDKACLRSDSLHVLERICQLISSVNTSRLFRLCIFIYKEAELIDQFLLQLLIDGFLDFLPRLLEAGTHILDRDHSIIFNHHVAESLHDLPEISILELLDAFHRFPAFPLCVSCCGPCFEKVVIICPADEIAAGAFDYIK